ncbi:hypothetical protein AB0O42_25210 [Streptomyces sp. NPDC089922]|uniref:hypothetical protein n=1 Tax=unclassified Streptomyces TaxID=2593676 RepID=UPI0033D14DAA
MTGRRTPRPAAAAAAAALAGSLLLTGCGIKTTGVIESGHAAKVAVPDGGGATVYYVSKDGEHLVPTPFGFDGYSISPAVLVRVLLDGPKGRAQEAGLTTQLPRMPEGKTDGFSSTPYSPESGITLRVPFPVAGLSQLARLQLVCTVAVSSVKDVVTPVTLQGTDTTLPSAECRLRS